jgi:hypothetical protein
LNLGCQTRTPVCLVIAIRRTDSVGTGLGTGLGTGPGSNFTNRLVSIVHLVSLAVCVRKGSRRWKRTLLIQLPLSASTSYTRFAKRIGRIIRCNMVLYADRGPDVAAAVITMVSRSSSSSSRLQDLSYTGIWPSRLCFSIT